MLQVVSNSVRLVNWTLTYVCHQGVTVTCHMSPLHDRLCPAIRKPSDSSLALGADQRIRDVRFWRAYLGNQVPVVILILDSMPLRVSAVLTIPSMS
jgi:hypothetical protein